MGAMTASGCMVLLGRAGTQGGGCAAHGPHGGLCKFAGTLLCPCTAWLSVAGCSVEKCQP